MPKLRVTLSVGLAGANRSDIIEIDDDEWNECETDACKEKLIDLYATAWAWEYIDIDAQILLEE